MGFLLYYLMEVFYKKNFKLVYLLYIALFSYIILRIKLYILLALVIGFVFFLLFNKIEKVRNPILRIMVLPLSLLVLGGMLTIVGSAFEDSLKQFAFSNILDTIKTNYDYLTQENFASSRYTLGEIEPTLGSVAKLAPASINVTLFRPYLWETNKPITLLAALESLLTLGLTLFVLFTVRLRALYFIFSEKFVLFCFIFCHDI
ncbi:MAG: hypothetical protein IPI46_14795 [Bacteroidetes bacterium]|nr:hypothetical protein [Bacteroidota bacterium]